MQVRLFILLMCFGSVASAQVFQTNNTPYKFKGIKTDSMLVIPSGPDTVRLASPKWGESMVGALFFRTTDSTLWGRSANKWNKLSGGGATIDTTSISNRINAKVDKSTTLTINGTTYDLSANRSWTIAAGDTTGIGDLYIRNLATPQENKRFNVKAGRLDSLYASTSGGGRVVSNNGTVAAEWGQGGGSNFDFHGFAGYNANRAASYTVRSFTDKNYVDSSLALKGAGTVTSVATGLGLTGGPITTSGIVSLDTASASVISRQRAAATYNKMVSSFAKNATRDSAILTLSDGTRLAVRDSVGSGGGGGVGSDSLAVRRVGSGSINHIVSFNSISAGSTKSVVATDGSRDSSNIFIGNASGAGSLGSYANVGLGNKTLNAITNGYNNFAMGLGALQKATTAFDNTAVGAGALLELLTGNGNLAIGNSALRNNTANQNTGIGTAAGSGNTSGVRNTFIGHEAAKTISSQNDITAIGYQSLLNATSSTNTAVGAGAGLGITSVGEHALLGDGIMGVSNTGSSNSVVGSKASTVLTGSHNVSFGTGSMFNATSADGNVSLGRNNMRNLSTGDYNIGIGSFIDMPSNTASGQLNIGAVIFGIGMHANTTTIATPEAGGRIGIGVVTPAASAVLDVTSTNKGFLPPRMTTADKIAISSPAAGLIVYDTTLNKLCVFTTVWETITSL